MLKLVSKDYTQSQTLPKSKRKWSARKESDFEKWKIYEIKNEFEPQEEYYVQDYYQLKLVKKYAKLY